MIFNTLQTKRQFIADKVLVGIDPGRDKHQAAIIDAAGIALCKPFRFKPDFAGFNKLLKQLNTLELKINPRNCVIAIERSCNLWRTLAHYLHSKGFSVVLVSPVITKRSRPFFNHDFSKTDPKDALLVASNARNGYFDFFRDFSDQVRAMHQLSLTYDKLRKNLVQNKQRLRDQIQLVFPEFLSVINSDIDTARMLLRDYFLPRHYLQLDGEAVAEQMEAVSRKQHGKETLNKLIELAQNSVGIPVPEELEEAVRLTIRSWITMLETVQTQMKVVIKQLIALAKQTRYFEILTSLKGISEVMASFFVAETRVLEEFDHYKKLEKYAGHNLRQTQSGNYVGRRHISHIGNHRLSWVLYKMTEETARYIPEVRMKFLRRQLMLPKYRKNIVAASSNLLKLIVALVRENRPYQWNQDNLRALEMLEQQYQQKKARKKAYRLAS